METQTQSNPQGTMPPSGNNFLGEMENFFETYLHKKAPFHLPVGVKEFIVNYGPYIMLIFAIIGLLGLLSIFGVGTFMSPMFWAANVNLGITWYISVGLAAAASVMEIVAFSPLKKRHISGWKLLYHATLISALGQLIGMNIISAVIGLVIGMYLIFQVKEYYK